MDKYVELKTLSEYIDKAKEMFDSDSSGGLEYLVFVFCINKILKQPILITDFAENLIFGNTEISCDTWAKEKYYKINGIVIAIKSKDVVTQRIKTIGELIEVNKVQGSGRIKMSREIFNHNFKVYANQYKHL